MSKLEVIRAALLAVVGITFLAFDVYVTHARADPGRAFGMLAVLQAEAALLVGVVALWPDRRWLRLVVGVFVLAMVWLAMAKLPYHFVFQPTLLSQLTISLLMLACVILPSGIWFALYRKISGRRLSLLRRGAQADRRVQFGIRHLLILTSCFAVVAFAARAVCPASLDGQFVLQYDADAYWILALLCLTPGLIAGPLAVSVMRPTWWAILLVPWFLVVVICEVFFAVDWARAELTWTVMLQVMMHAVRSGAIDNFEFTTVLVVACVAARLGGLNWTAPHSALIPFVRSYDHIV